MSTSRCCNTTDPNEKPAHDHAGHSHGKRDYILIFSTFILLATISTNWLLPLMDIHAPHSLHHFAHTSIEILLSMWWGVALGIVVIGIMSKIPREFFTAIMGKGGNISGLFRAVFGGVLLDLCCHGILLVAAKLYERGVSLAQVVTFLVASPWNSLSLTLVLVALIGLKWTLLYILGSVVIALFSGFILQRLTIAGFIPANPNTPEEADTPFHFFKEAKALWKQTSFSKKGTLGILKTGWNDGKMIIKWLLFGTIIAACLRTFIPAEEFAHWLGTNVLGLFITLFFATIVEICSEGSAPIAGEIVTNANAPGNGFTFLMAGVGTDYTEFMAVREFTKSWAMAAAIPLITVPQILLIGWLMNIAS